MSITISNPQLDDPESGYFRIGNVILKIPPEDINIHKTSNVDELTALRAKFPYINESGFARWDVTVSWTAVYEENPQNYSDSPSFSENDDPHWAQWEDVRTIVAMMKAAPFVEVENDLVRSVISSRNDESSYSGIAVTDSTKYVRLAFALRQFKVSTSEDIVDGLKCQLVMTLFNYLPFTKDFAYVGTGGLPVDATQSDAFKKYLNEWKENNLDAPQEGEYSPWQEQDPEDTSFIWRTYMPQPGLPVAAPSDLDVDEWKCDHFTDDMTYRYKENRLHLDSSDGSSSEEGLFPTNLSVVFVNQFAQLPLANYQYPTYQHIGPATTVISMGMESDSAESLGVTGLTGMINELKKQFLQFRSWKSAASIYNRQAILVRNQFLNMLGVWGLNVAEFDVSTIQNSAGRLSCTLMARQYENYYELLDPFTVYGSDHYTQQLSSYIRSPALTAGLTQAEQSGMQKLVAFRNAWNGYDDKYLANLLLSTDPTTASTLKTLPSIPMPSGVSLTPTEQANLFLTLKEESPLSATVSRLPGTAGYGSTPFDSSYWPWLAAKNSPGYVMSYTDYWVLTRLNTLSSQNDPTRYQADLAIQQKYDPQVTQAMKDQIWQKAFELLAANDRVMSNNLDQIARSKSFKDSLDSSTQAQGLYSPGSDPSNGKHGCYRDLGIYDGDPAEYFIDYSNVLLTTAAQQMEQNLSVMLTGFKAFNTKNQQGQGTTIPTDLSDFGIQEGNVSGMLLRSNIPKYSMRGCFPTFKLFLMEDKNTSIFYCYDNFYSYASVIDMEMIKYRDKPDTAVIRITNLSGMLSYRLFDNSVQGKREWELSNDVKVPTSLDGSPTVNPGGMPGAVMAGRMGNHNYQEGQGSLNSPGETFVTNQPKVPLRYYPLQTGSKIQVRLGYSNNPDGLYPVFVGQVTQIDEEDGIITLVAQSYLTELDTSMSDEVSSDGFSVPGLVGNIINSVTDAAIRLVKFQPMMAFRDLWAGLTYVRAPAYGGWLNLSGDGDASNVIKAILKISQARHFGKWQIGGLPDRYVKGFTWSDTLAALGGTGPIASTLNNSYDRSGANILVNHLVNYSGTEVVGKFPVTRSWTFEQPGCTKPVYHIKGGTARTPWFYIKDVGRRYPDYVLAVRQYGFPYQANATCIFGHPNDFYYSRDLILGELTAMKLQPAVAKPIFADWWDHQQGRSQTAAMLYNYLIPVLPGVQPGDTYVNTFMNKIDSTKDPNVYFQQLDSLNTMINRTGNDLLSWWPGVQNYQMQSFRTEVNYLRNSLEYYLTLKINGTIGKVNEALRIQPVRRWNYIDHESIIHNGIKLSDKFFNTIKLSDDTLCINEMIPSHHQRVLDADELVESVDKNLKSGGNEPMRLATIQSFLREECGKMYYGELIIKGTPEIEPWDVVVITDPATGMMGPVEVDSVIHTFNQEMGFITIIKPRALIIVNDAASMGLLNGYRWAWANATQIINGYSQAYGDATTAIGVTTPTLLGVVAGGTAAAIFGGPIGDVVAVMVAGRAFATAINISTRMNLCMVFPLMRFGNPWVGGLQGYRAGDIVYWLKDHWIQFYTDEIAPLMSTWRK